MASAFHPITYEDSVYMVCYGYLGLKRAISNLGKSQGYLRPAARAAPDAKRITIIKSSSLFTQHVIFLNCAVQTVTGRKPTCHNLYFLDIRIKVPFNKVLLCVIYRVRSNCSQ